MTQTKDLGDSSAGAVTRDKGAREITIPEVITVQDLATRLSVRPAEVLDALGPEGKNLNASDTIATDAAIAAARKLGVTAKVGADSGRPARMTLTRQHTVESGHVRQNFSHGRFKSV